PEPWDLLDPRVHVHLPGLHGGDHVPEYERRPDEGGLDDAAVLRVGVPGVHIGASASVLYRAARRFRARVDHKLAKRCELRVLQIPGHVARHLPGHSNVDSGGDTADGSQRHRTLPVEHVPAAGGVQDLTGDAAPRNIIGIAQDDVFGIIML
ncbi:hypothetical protein F443_09504, partial [Phytophthora nicotianae P1569]